jgi:hypothetical protein
MTATSGSLSEAIVGVMTRIEAGTYTPHERTEHDRLRDWGIVFRGLPDGCFAVGGDLDEMLVRREDRTTVRLDVQRLAGFSYCSTELETQIETAIRTGNP